MSEPIRIRRAELTDAVQIQQVYEHVGTYSGTLQLPFPSVETWQERLKKSDANRILLVAEINGAVVGTAGLHLEPGMRRRHVAGIGIGVADPYVGRGVGTALFSELTKLADNWLGLLRLELEVFVDNEPALALYRKFGFEIEGTHRASALRNGVYTDVYSMARLHPKQALVRN
jgi:putative acetyltransferase